MIAMFFNSLAHLLQDAAVYLVSVLLTFDGVLP